MKKFIKILIIIYYQNRALLLLLLFFCLSSKYLKSKKMTEQVNNALFSVVQPEGKVNEKLSASPNAAFKHPLVLYVF